MTRIVPTALEFVNHAYDKMEGKLAIPPNRWTDIERAIIPLIVLQDHPDAESVEMRDDGAMLLKLADADQTRMNEIDLSGLTICSHEFEEVDGYTYVNHAKVGEKFLISTEADYLFNRLGHKTREVTIWRLNDLCELAEESNMEDMPLLMFLRLKMHRWFFKWRYENNGLSQTDPNWRDDGADTTGMTEALTLPNMTKFEEEDRRILALNLRNSVIRYALARRDQLGLANIEDYFLKILRTKTNARWWVGKGLELRSLQSLENRGVISAQDVYENFSAYPVEQSSNPI